MFAVAVVPVVLVMYVVLVVELAGEWIAGERSSRARRRDRVVAGRSPKMRFV
jgi:hypothetical protein